MSNFVIAVAMDTLRSEQFRHRGCDSHFAQGANSFSQLRDPLRSEQFHFRGRDSRFAQETVLISQVAGAFCTLFKPWFPIAEEPLTPGI